MTVEQTTLRGEFDWLAQCKRRLDRPLDYSERAGLSAFEYAWKAYNSLYSRFTVKPDRNKMDACLDAFLDYSAYFSHSVANLKTLCSFLLQNSNVTMYGDAKFQRIVLQAGKHGQALTQAIDSNDARMASRCLVDILYVFRNARVHGEINSRDMQFIRTLPECTLDLCIYLLSGREQLSPKRVRLLIDKLERLS